MKGKVEEKMSYVQAVVKKPELNAGELKESIDERLSETIQNAVYRKSKAFWKEAKNVLEKGNNSPFVYYDYFEAKYVFVKGTESEELEFEACDSLWFKGNEVIISPLVYQRLYNEKKEDSFACHVISILLERHLQKTIVSEIGQSYKFRN